MRDDIDRKQVARETTALLMDAIVDFPTNFILIGKLLDVVARGKFWILYNDTFDLYLKDTLEVKRARAYAALRCYRKFGEWADIEKVPPTRLTKLLSLHLSVKEVPHWLRHCMDMTPKQFNSAVRVRSGRPSTLRCQHKNLVTTVRCLDCHKTISSVKHTQENIGGAIKPLQSPQD